jgi:DNA-directed RNA polymerase specialized sigma24 family protein
MNIELLVKEYKQSQNKKILNTIFLSLKKLIEKKAKYIYHKKFYPLSLYGKCSACRNCQDRTKCEECQSCTCIKGTFNLKRNHLCDYRDVEDDLWLEILRIIKNYDITKNFDTYLYASLWEWRPSFVNKNLLKEIETRSLTRSEDCDNVSEDVPDYTVDEENKLGWTIEEIEKICKTENEKKVLSILVSNNRLNQEEIAEKSCLTRQTVSKIIKNFRKKIKNLT